MTDLAPRWVVSGGIGTGKSAVRTILEDRGFHAIDADSIGHQVLEIDEVVDRIERRWPTVVNAGVVDRPALAAIVFEDRLELEALENITHPHIFGRILDQVSRIDGPVVVEVPLIEHRLGDGWTTVVVDVRAPVRIERLLSRGMDEADARSRIGSQPSRMEWLAVADVVIPNNGTLDELAESVDRLLGQSHPQNLSQ